MTQQIPPVGGTPTAAPAGAPAAAPQKTKTIALILSCLGLVGICGIHRFYVGKTGTGIIWLLTLGLLGIGQLIDFIMILMGTFKDKDGVALTVW